jgi:hypothetical protein
MSGGAGRSRGRGHGRVRVCVRGRDRGVWVVGQCLGGAEIRYEACTDRNRRYVGRLSSVSSLSRHVINHVTQDWRFTHLGHLGTSRLRFGSVGAGSPDLNDIPKILGLGLGKACVTCLG